MESKEIDTKNEVFFLKIKQHKKKIPFRKRDINSSILKDYDKLYKEIYDEVLNIEKKKDLKDRFLIIVMPHPEIKDIFIFSKEQWDLYYSYNIIEKCKSNKSLKIEYIINKTQQKNEKLENNVKQSRQEIIKYIIKTIPCAILFNILIKFFEENENFADKLKEYMITDLINNYKKDEKDSNKNIDENININKITNYDEKNETNINDYKELDKIYKGYYIDNNEFINSLKNKFNIISKFDVYLKSFNEIKNTLNEDEEKNEENIKKEEKNKKDIDIEQNKNNFKTSLNLQTRKSLVNLLFDNSSVNVNNDLVLQSVLNPPSSKFVSDLMEKDSNFFKKLNDEEYYKGIVEYKDQLNRESYLILTKNS